MMSKQIYLAGAMEFTPDNGAGWRSSVTSVLKNMRYRVFNPCTDEGMILEKYGYETGKEFLADKLADYDKFEACMQDIAKVDLIQLAASNYVIAYITENLRGGTDGEVTCAKYIFNTPVIAVLEPGLEYKNCSGWVLACCDKVFYNFQEAVDYIRAQDQEKE